MRSTTVLLAFVLFIAIGSELMTMKGAEGQCEQKLWGGGCEEKSCSAACVEKYGQNAWGRCFFYQKPDDTCLCRHPCQSV